MHKKTLGTLAILALAGLGLAQNQVWTMATPYPDGNFHTINIREFARDVEAATQGRLSIRVNSGGSLLPHPQILPGVRSGQIQMGEVLISLLSNENPVFDLDTIPFLVSSYEEALRLYQVSRGEIENWLSRRGMTLLFSVPWPGQGLYTRQPVNSVADLRGVRFRAYNRATARIAELTGMVPTQVEAADIPQAFATGIVAAMITSPSTGVDSQAWDFTRYFYDLRAWIPKNMVFVSRRALDSLSPADREAVLAAARRAEERGWRASQQEAASKTAILAQRGMRVLQPSPQLTADLKKVGQTMTEEWLRRAGAVGVNIYRAYLGR
ncbi:TRAP transporter substrate-binding protein [Meiothermus rufus]|uniref:TRAP transporter substrate-binding protein n=1 Tax=Meiothermus rufus TaxID=604332 RepID=UPI000405F227|nr:TRAP transporter substrate-binding protein [Meiothermus rufus]